MSSVRAAPPTKPQPLHIIVGFLALSAIEIGLVLLYYLVHYAANRWFAHPTNSGIAILSGLLLMGFVSAYLFFGYWRNSPKAKALSKVLSQRYLSGFLMAVLSLATAGLAAINFYAFPGLTRLYQLIHKHPLIVILFILLGLQGLITLILIRLKYDELPSLIGSNTGKSGAGNNLLESNRQVLLRFSKRYWIHILVWCVVLLYLLIGPVINTSFVLKSGKPVSLAIALPPSTGLVMYSVDQLEPIKMNGQELYDLWGWSFYIGNPDPAAYDRYVVLQSETRIYYFTVDSVPRSDVQKAFAGLNQNLVNCGFSGLIAKDVVRPGRYTIGILFQPKAGGAPYYIATHDRLIRTANTLQLAYR